MWIISIKFITEKISLYKISPSRFFLFIQIKARFAASNEEDIQQVYIFICGRLKLKNSNNPSKQKIRDKTKDKDKSEQEIPTFIQYSNIIKPSIYKRTGILQSIFEFTQVLNIKDSICNKKSPATGKRCLRAGNFSFITIINR